MPILTTHVQYLFPNYCHLSFIYLPATPLWSICATQITRLLIITIFHIMYNNHIHLVQLVYVMYVATVHTFVLYLQLAISWLELDNRVLIICS